MIYFSVMGLLDEISSGRVLVSDGGMGTMLQARGMPVGICPEMMNIEKPDVVRAITADYIKVGAMLVEANTFGANSFILEKYGLRDRLAEINKAGVRLAKDAVAEVFPDAETKVLIFASLGPAGIFLEPLGNISREELKDAVTEQVEAFKEAGVDGVCVETMSDMAEAEISVNAVKETGMECIALMCFEPSPRGYHTMMGVDIPRAVNVLVDSGVDAIGAGCGVGSADMVEIAREIRSLTDYPLVIHPNAGRPEYKGGKTTYPETPEMMAEKALELVGLGVNIVGGCCGTTPEHIGAIVKALMERSN